MGPTHEGATAADVQGASASACSAPCSGLIHAASFCRSWECTLSCALLQYGRVCPSSGARHVSGLSLSEEASPAHLSSSRHPDLLEHYFPNAKVYVYDFDSTASQNPLLGPAVVQYLRSTLDAPVHMGVIIRDPTGKTFDDVAKEIVGEKAWAAVVINANATSNFREAVAGTGGLLDGRWAPEGAISLVVSGARWYQVTDDYILPYLGEQMRTPTQQASRQAVARCLSTVTPATLGGLSQTQQAALLTPFSYQNTDLRPIHPNQWSGAAPYVPFLRHLTRGGLLTRSSCAAKRQA